MTVRGVVARYAVVGWATVLAVLLLWPQRLAGYGLGRDMVFTPQQPLGTDALGVGSAPPRAVPVDALVALLEKVVDGAVVGRVALAVPLLLAGVGAARLLGASSLPARLAACGVAVWNPFVVERLALGQWSLLWGYAALPWVLLACAAIRTGRRTPVALVLPLAAASITPTGGALALLVVVACLAPPRRWSGVVVALLMQAPWVVAGVLTTARTVSDPASVAAFASRSEYGGVLPTLLGLGGTWNAAVVPPSRSTVAALATVVVLVVAAVLGAARARALLGPSFPPLTVVAAIGLVLALASSVPGADAAVRWVVAEVPGGGLLRDAQKWIAPLALLAAVLVGAAVDAIEERVAVPLVTVVALALPLALLPDATRAVWPTVTPVHYPSAFAAVARIVGNDDVAVLPFAPYRAFSWAHGRPSYDPANRLLPATVVGSDRLTVDGRELPGEDPRAAAVAAALSSGPSVGARLADAGVRWVLVETATPGTVPALQGLSRVLVADGVRLYRVPGGVRSVGPSATAVTLAAVVLALWVLAVLAAALAAAGAAALRVRRRRAEPADDLERQADR